MKPYESEWEEDEDEPKKFVDMTNKELEDAFCLSGVFNHVFDGQEVYEDDFSIVDD